MSDKGRFVLVLTQSQKMALTDALVEHLRCPNSTEVFINCSIEPVGETTMGDLIRLVTDAKFFDGDDVDEFGEPKERAN